MRQGHRMQQEKGMWQKGAGLRRLFFCLVFGLLVGGGCNETRVIVEDTPDSLYAYVVGEYTRIRGTRLSTELYPELVALIEDRQRCYVEKQGYSDRIDACRRDYLNRILETARVNIKAAPLLGNFIICIRDCPISHAICAGERSEHPELPCTDVEAQCIEYCLDLYWRGGVPETPPR